MSECLQPFAAAVPLGVAATVFIDAWALLRRRLFGIPALDYALVGRWLAHLPRGRFRHASIAAADAVRGEGLIGWTAHYLIGVAFAAALLVVAGAGWLSDPTLAPALLVGLASAAAPFLLLQPGFGAGVAASRTPRPWRVRAQTVLTHTLFGVGLYLAALAAKRLELLQ
ncbi:DUF2938 domain-containing protein [Tahibacter caeni]|uniref:DUF2938 domain-containing protein n=1 Tax=Tahibacter caeni TaxID=1453545 RepID=UPI00214818D3|nr:DUF2938 domain-containing protein [Tahibacter caeni]